MNNRFQGTLHKVSGPLNSDVQFIVAIKEHTVTQTMCDKMNKWHWLALIPTLALAGHPQPSSMNLRKDPVYVDVQPDQVIICPENTVIPSSRLTVPGNEFEQLLEDIERVRHVRYAILVLRPGSEKLHRQLRQIVQKYPVDIGFEPWEAGQPVSQEEMSKPYIAEYLRHKLTTIAVPEPQPPTYVVDMQKDRILLTRDNLAVSRDELETPGNAFEALVDRLEAEGGNTLVIFDCDELNEIKAWLPVLVPILVQRAPKLAQRMMNEADAQSQITVLAPTPLEVPADGREPVYWLCQSKQLFSVSAVGQTKSACISDLSSFDPASRYICFLVRPDSIALFREARKAAWEQGLDISCELQAESGPLVIGADGRRLFPEETLQQNEDFEQADPRYPPQSVESPGP